jgi:hypothetical protein
MMNLEDGRSMPLEALVPTPRTTKWDCISEDQITTGRKFLFEIWGVQGSEIHIVVYWVIPCTEDHSKKLILYSGGWSPIGSSRHCDN